MKYCPPVLNDAIDDSFGHHKVLDKRSDLPVDRANVSLGNKLDDLLAQDFLLIGG
jgi:hypothetical protein